MNIDMAKMNKEELIELRQKVNARIASLTALEKRKHKPRECRNRVYYFDNLALAQEFVERYKDQGIYDFADCGKLIMEHTMGRRYYAVYAFCSKDFNEMVQNEYEVSRLYFGNEGNGRNYNEYKIGHMVGNTYILRSKNVED